MNGLQQRCIRFSEHLRKLALGYPQFSREQRRLLRGAVHIRGYAELLGGEATDTAARLYRIAHDEYRKVLTGVGLDPERVGKPSDPLGKNQIKDARPVVQGIVVLLFPARKSSPPKRKKQVGSHTSSETGTRDQQKGSP